MTMTITMTMIVGFGQKVTAHIQKPNQRQK